MWKKNGVLGFFSFMLAIWAYLSLSLIQADVGLIGSYEEVALFYGIDNEIVMKQCENYTVLMSRSDCKVKSGTVIRQIPVAEFRNSLRMALKFPGHYDAVTRLDIEVYNQRKNGKVQDLLEERWKLEEQIFKVEAFVEEFGVGNSGEDQGLYDLKLRLFQVEAQLGNSSQLGEVMAKMNTDIGRLKDQIFKVEAFAQEFGIENDHDLPGMKQKLSQLESQLEYLAHLRDFVQKIVTNIDGEIDGLIQAITDSLKTPQESKYSFSKDGTGFAFNLLKAYVQNPGLVMSFKRIEAGNFTMGSSKREKGRKENEKRVKVKISRPFEMMTTEVTQMMWFDVMESNPSHFRMSRHCDNHLKIGLINLCPSHPVESVSWSDVQAYIRKLNSAEGVTGCQGTPQDPTGCYRLPTEAEWEYVARGGTETAYFFGENALDLGEYAWYSRNSDDKTHIVGLKRPNLYGLYDMYGNVWEWVQDNYTKDLSIRFYRFRRKTDPLYSNSGTYHVLRGGSYDDFSSSLRSAYRSANSHSKRGYGFRLVRTL